MTNKELSEEEKAECYVYIKLNESLLGGKDETLAVKENCKKLPGDKVLDILMTLPEYELMNYVHLYNKYIKKNKGQECKR